jgi:hypothetical protein
MHAHFRFALAGGIALVSSAQLCITSRGVYPGRACREKSRHRATRDRTIFLPSFDDPNPIPNASGF